MDIQNLAKHRRLVSVSLDDEHIISKYGEPIEFYTWDRVDTTDFIRINTLDTHSDPVQVFGVMRDFILDDTGEPVIKDDVSLPMDILTSAVRAVSECLGKCWTPRNWTVKAPSFAL